MKKLFKVKGQNEKNYDEITSQIMDEHYAAVEQFKQSDINDEKLSEAYTTEAEQIIDDINDLLDKAQLREAYWKGRRRGLIDGAVAAFGGMAIGTALVYMKIKE